YEKDWRDRSCAYLPLFCASVKPLSHAPSQLATPNCNLPLRRCLMPEYADLLYEIDSNVATITLNRPDRLNAISGPMLESLSQALRDADHDRDVRVIVITGAGRGFCAGLDLKDLVAGTGIGSNGADGLAN